MVAPPPRDFASFGANSWIVPPARVAGAEYISIGSRFSIQEHGVLVARRRLGQPEPALRLGDDTRIQRFVNIVCFGSITIGSGVLVGDRAYVSDVDFPMDAVDTDVPTELVDPRPIVIGDFAFLGAGCIIKPGVTIGNHAYVSGSSVVTEDVPERTLVAGAPARAVKRWGPSE